MPEINLADYHLPYSAYKTFSSETAKTLGVKAYEIGENPKKVLKYGSDVNGFINSVAADRKTGPTVNVFWLENYKDKKETLFVQIPFNQEGKTSSAAIVLQTDSRTREIISQLLTSPGTTQEALKEYLIALLEPSGTKIDPEKINTTTLAYLSSSANKLVLTATKGETIPFSKELAEPLKSEINIEFLPHLKKQSEPIPASTPLMSTVVKKTEPLDVNFTTVAEPKKHITEIITKNEAELKKIDETVTKRALEGKFIGKVTIHGEQFSSPDHNLSNTKDYHVLPEKSTTFIRKHFDPSNRMSAFYLSCYEDAAMNLDSPYRHTPEGFNFSDGLNIAYIRNPDDKNLTRLMIFMPNTDRDGAMRRTYFCILYCEIPTSRFEELNELIKKNPENAERFIQIAFAGLDEATGRVPVKKASIIDIDKYIPLGILTDKVRKGYNLQFFMSDAKRKGLLNTNAITTYNFSQPYP